MSNSIFTKLASIVTIIFFLGNDLLASVGAFHRLEMMEIAKYTSTGNYSDALAQPETTNYPKTQAKAQASGPIDPIVLPDLFSNRAADKTAFIGAHDQDPLGSPSDDVFSIDLQDQIKNYQFAYLQYEVKGIANAEELPKAINGGEVYVGGELKASDTWQRVTVMVDYEDLINGNNQVRFALSKSSELAAEVKNVQIHLTAKPKAVNKGLKMKRQMADEKDFKLLVSSENALTFKNKDLEMASIPKSIRNLTRNAWGYGLRNNANEVVKVAIGVNASKLNTPNDLKEANIFYYNTSDNSWKKAHTEKVDMANLVLEASVPPNTDYFAGLIKSPDMPEASAFLPTGISDIEAANPAAGMNLISPPSQSRTGEASISFPLQIPAGRQGLAPSLALSYSSDGGSGWAGFGWSLSVPSVSIDTRWGVPTFPANNQEEVYSLNGSPLNQEGGTKGNRAKVVNGAPELSPRLVNKNTVRFFERTMNGYKKIERVGQDPTEYVWIETTANNTKLYYGTQDGSNPDVNSTLKDANGNIVKWGLTKMEDQWGNHIKYFYHNDDFTVAEDPTLNPMKDGGKYFILDRIEYTGHNNDPGQYKVYFESTANRPDATVSMKTGFKVLDDHRLDKIVVKYGTTLIKDYRLNYGEGDFKKTRLNSIDEYRKGSFFYSHDFEYYSGSLTFGDEQTFAYDNLATDIADEIAPELDFLVNPILNILNASPIKTSSTWGWSSGGSVGLGIAPIGDYASGKVFTLSGQIGYSESYSKDKRSLMDMNGDGLLDMIVSKKNQKGFYPLEKTNSGLKYGTFVDIHNNNQPLFKNKSATQTHGFDFSLSDAIMFYGKNWSNTTSTVQSFTTDYNADGFPDLVVEDNDGDSKVLFGSLNSVNELNYSPSSANTSNPVFKNQPLDAINTDDDDLKDLEMVKIWTAPFTGTVNISGLAENVGTTSGETRVAVQKNNSFMVHNFRAVDANTSISTNYNGKSVTKGDVLLFRAKSAVDGQQDLLTWNPRVEYTNINYSDGNGISYTDSKYEDAFIPSGAEYITIQGDQKIKVDLNRSISGALTDDIVYEMTVEEFNSSQVSQGTKVYTNLLDAGTTDLSDESFSPSTGSAINFGPGTFQNLPGFVAANTYRLHFSIFSTSNVHWRNIKFRPTVEVSMIGTCDLGATMYPTIEYGTYNRVEHMSDWLSLEGVEENEEIDYRIWPTFSASTSQVQAIFENASGSNTAVAYMTVKDGNETLSKLGITFHQSNGTISYFNCNEFGKSINSVSSASAASAYSMSSIDVNNDLSVEFFVDGYTFSQKTAELIKARLSRIAVQDNENGPWQNLITSTEDFNIFFKDPSYVGDKILHWGQFAWSFENTTAENTEIPTADLQPDIEALASDTENQFDSENTPETSFFDENSDLLDPMGHKFIVLKALRGEKDYVLRSYEKSSYTDLQSSNLLSSTVGNEVENLDRYACMGSHIGIYASSGMSSPGKFGETEIIVIGTSNQVPDDLYMAFAAPMVTKSKSSSTTTGNLLFSISGSNNDVNKYFSKSIIQFQDYNGDGYPDRIVDDGTNVNANFTSPVGGHKSSQILTSYDLSKGVSNNVTSAKPGSFVDKDQRFEKMGAPTLNFGTNGDLIQHMDINGDGLPDRIEASAANGIIAALNYGSGIGNSNAVSNYSEGVSETRNGSISLSLSPDLLKLDKMTQSNGASFKMGIGINHSSNRSNTVFIDLNGDGLSDCITLDGKDATVFINTGTSFYEHSDVELEKELNDASGFGFSGSVAGTYAFPAFSIPVLGIDLKVSVNANGGANFSQNEVQSSFQDVNGDGYTDFIWKDEGGMKVKYGQIGKSNLLKKVNNPLGGSFVVDYERVGNQTGFRDPVVKTHLNENNKILWDMPNSKWVLSSLIIDDGLNPTLSSVDLDGSDQIQAHFYYDGGIKSRRERDFLGFTRTEKRQMPFSDPNNRNGSELSGFEFGQGSVATTGTMYYISEVNQYMEPTSNNFLYRKRSEYTKSVITENFTYLNKKTAIENTNDIIIYSSEFYPISMNMYSYDFRNVCIDPSSTYFNELYPETDPASNVDWLLIDETQSIFAAMSSIQKVQYPEVVDPNLRSLYASQKFLLTYDDRWNVIQYEDEGKLVTRNSGTTVVESFTRDWYDYKTQSQAFSTLVLSTELSDEHFNGYYVSCNDPTYSTAVVYIAKKADPCFGFAEQNYPDDNFMVVTEHKKQMTETVQILTPSFNDVYVDKLIAVMEYFEPSAAAGQPGVLKTHKIYENSIAPANLKRHSEVATLFQSKVPSSLWNVLSITEKAITDIKYNSYGNVSQVKGPENATSQRMTVDFTYDSSVNQFVTGVSNSYGESTCSFYDFETGNLLKSVDINGHAMRYVYDDMFRMEEVWAPRQLYDSEASPTISFEYFPFGIDPNGASNEKVPVAITKHNMDVSKASNANSTPQSNCSQLADLSQRDPISNPLRTATFIDGMSRAIQVKKDVSKSNGSHQNIAEIMVSGWAKNDQWAKQVEMSNTVLESSSDPFGSLYLHDSPYMSQAEFDYLGRPKLEKAKVGKNGSFGYPVKKSKYSYGWDAYNSVEFITTDVETFDYNLNKKGHTRSFTNPRGRQRYSQQIHSTDVLTTEFVYNPLGELQSSVDPLGEVTSYQYDQFGRTTQEIHPDRGTTSWTYDLSGNLTHLNNEGTGNDDITFSYNYNRMTNKSMPLSGDLYDVQYTYGSLADGKNGAGRVTSVVQGTNFKTENYKYDELGNQIFEQKVINVPQTGTQTWTTEFDFDSWGRILEMLYPDGEEVYYHYTATGDLETIENSPLAGPLSNVPRYTVKKITYDGFGNIDYMQYGNDAEIKFVYDPLTRSMDSVKQFTKGVNDTNLLETYDQIFTYDGIGRIGALDQIKVITQTGSANTVVGYDYDYTYDNFNRLTATTGSIDGETFNMALTYNAAGGILTKNQSLGTGNSYNLTYDYQVSNKHQIDEVDGHIYTYNAAGSIDSIIPTSTPTVPSEKFVWNEEEWLMAVENSNGYHHYVYDHNGERIMKSSLTSGQTAIDGEGNTNTAVLDPYAVYVNPYYIVTRYSVNQDVSKHYYMGSQRVATERLVWGEGTGGTESESENGENQGMGSSEKQNDTESNALNNLSQAGEAAVKSNPVTESFAKILTNLGLEENKDFDRASMDKVSKMDEYYDLSLYGNTETGEDPDDEDDYYYTRERYWYHPNYLGNVDMITNDNGQIHQYFVYSPFGENMYQYNRNSDFNSRYRFNGKEIDPETGNQYYGARFYDPKISVWLSVDPLAHEYPNLSAYNFVAGNPVQFVDPDGRDIWEIDKQGNAVFVKASEGLIINNQKMSEFDWSGNEKAFGQINQHYAGEAGIKADASQVFVFDKNGQNTNETPSEWENIPKQPQASQAISKEMGNGKEGIVASLQEKDGKLLVYDKTDYSNKNNLMSSLVHENRHLQQNRKKYSAWDELDAIQHQMKHSSWSKTDSKYKQEIKGYAKSNYKFLMRYFKNNPEYVEMLNEYKDNIGF